MNNGEELPYFGTRDNPTQLAEDVAPEADLSVKNELMGMKSYFQEMLAGLTVDPKQPADEYKIEGLANEKVRRMIEPIIAVIDNKLKGVK